MDAILYPYTITRPKNYHAIRFSLPIEQAVLKEVTESEGQVVMFIDEIHTVVGAGATSGSMDASNLLKPMLARGELRCIGATTLNEYKQVQSEKFTKGCEHLLRKKFLSVRARECSSLIVSVHNYL